MQYPTATTVVVADGQAGHQLEFLDYKVVHDQGDHHLKTHRSRLECASWLKGVLPEFSDKWCPDRRVRVIKERRDRPSSATAILVLERPQTVAAPQA
ncbi:hypothetical protein ON010_g13577 [Phytophthora cinnamomi]|nr:hypothetical protein ON010_g13577 [Phytophthora cinnamomi]